MGAIRHIRDQPGLEVAIAQSRHLQQEARSQSHLDLAAQSERADRGRPVQCPYRCQEQQEREHCAQALRGRLQMPAHVEQSTKQQRLDDRAQGHRAGRDHRGGRQPPTAVAQCGPHGLPRARRRFRAHPHQRRRQRFVLNVRHGTGRRQQHRPSQYHLLRIPRHSPDAPVLWRNLIAGMRGAQCQELPERRLQGAAAPHCAMPRPAAAPRPGVRDQTRLAAAHGVPACAPRALP